MKKLLSLMMAVSATAVFAAQVTDVSVIALDGFGGDAGSVLTRCQTKAGAEYDPAVVTRDVSALRDSAEFEEINADAVRSAEGVAVTFMVRRKVRYVAPLTVVGCDYFSESRVAKEADLKDGFLYGEADLAAAAGKVRLAYQKKFYSDAKVEVSTVIGRGNDATVTFTVTEGRQQKVNDYVYRGRTSVEEKLLDEAIDNLPWWNPVGWFTDDPVTDDQRAQCCDKLAKVYRDRGYLDVRVSGPERIPAEDAPGKVDVVFTIEEGIAYTIGTSEIRGVTKYPVETVAEKSELPQAGEVAGEQALEDAAHRIKVTVGSGDSGLADTRVDVKTVPDLAKDGVVNIIYQVKEGVPVVIDDVKIRGNDYTMDKVIRREIALGPGDRMLEDRAERSQKRLENLDYFSRVRYYLEPSDGRKDANGAEYRNLVYEVEEKNTGSFMVGVGASSVDSVYISAEVNQNNFDLFAPSKLFRGAGQKGRVYVAWGPRYQSAEVGFVEPHLFNRMLELSVDIYRRMRWYDEYDLYRTGAMASLAYPVKFWPTWNPFGRLGVGISGEYIEFDEVDEHYYTYGNRSGQLFRDEERDHGDVFEPVIHLFWAKDSRDNFRMPTKGHRTRLSADLAPGGENTYWRLGVNHRSYFNTWKRFGHVFMVGLRAETIDAFSDEVPIYNRMFLGGPKTIRGIRYRYVAPMAKRMDRNDYVPWGGQTLFCMNFEYTVPIVQMLRLAVFSDLGSVGEDTFDFDFADTFAWTVGLGVRLDIPMFPIRLDFGVPMVEPDETEDEVFSFSVGYDF